MKSTDSKNLFSNMFLIIKVFKIRLILDMILEGSVGQIFGKFVNDLHFRQKFKDKNLKTVAFKIWFRQRKFFKRNLQAESFHFFTTERDP